MSWRRDTGGGEKPCYTGVVVSSTYLPTPACLGVYQLHAQDMRPHRYVLGGTRHSAKGSDLSMDIKHLLGIVGAVCYCVFSLAPC
jgi:hypothetical protein